MKNIHYQYLRQNSKGFHRKNREGSFESGIVTNHDFSRFSVNELSWNDDVTFILNNYRVFVAWSHPRWQYKQIIRSMALTQCSKDDLLVEHPLATPNLMRVGKSRKKVASFTTDSLVKPGMHELICSTENSFHQTNDIKIYPSFKVSWFRDCRYVDICAPIEVRSVADLAGLARLVRHLLYGTTSLNIEFPKYIYTKISWRKEQE